MQQLAAAGWILFRLNHLSDLPVYLHSLVARARFYAGFNTAEWMAVTFIGLTAIAHLVEIRVPITKTALTNRWNPWVMWVLLMAVIASTVLSLPKQQMFLYFQILVSCPGQFVSNKIPGLTPRGYNPTREAGDQRQTFHLRIVAGTRSWTSNCASNRSGYGVYWVFQVQPLDANGLLDNS